MRVRVRVPMVCFTATTGSVGERRTGILLVVGVIWSGGDAVLVVIEMLPGAASFIKFRETLGFVWGGSIGKEMVVWTLAFSCAGLSRRHAGV